MPAGYYALTVPTLLKRDRLPPSRRAELDSFGEACRTKPELSGMIHSLFDRLFPREVGGRTNLGELRATLAELGFDEVQHEQIRSDLHSGRIGLAQNRLPASSVIEDVQNQDVTGFDRGAVPDETMRRLGMEAIGRGEAAVVTLAAGIGSRWTQGAGVVKALHPFCRIAGSHRSFLDVHLAKTQRIARLAGGDVPLDPLSDDDGEESYAPIAYLADDTQEPSRVLDAHHRDWLASDGISLALESLDARSRRIVEERWLKVNDDSSGGMTLHDLAAEYGVSAERIRQIEVAAMKKMRKALAEAH